MTSKAPIPYPLDEVEVVQATRTDLIERTWLNNKAEWGKDTNLDAYLDRERHLQSQDLTRDGGIKTWIVVPRQRANPGSDKDVDPETILSALETFERPAWIARKEDGQVHEVLAISIASVFTPEKFRSYGYGSFLMKAIWQKAKEMGAEVSYLYSDVGPNYYGRLGWTVHRSDELIIPVSTTFPETWVSPSSSSTNTVQDKDLEAILTRDAELLKAELVGRLNSNSNSNNGSMDKDTTVLAALVPEPNCVRWLHARASFVGERILNKADKITDLGVVSVEDQDQFVLWYHDLLHDQLTLIRTRFKADQPGQARALIERAVDEARKWGLSKVVAWNHDPLLEQWTGLQGVTRSSTLPSLGLCQEKDAGKKVEWILNNYYAWC
ncbi:hypothetical protein DFQ27_007014 [Actinomortierella ambigua]|uniref:LYC1 C-terminal domain-containing protein n=1 Tax=Actinomortierella ambigua TaxID=1343610 RepID=A0A9P6PXE6_9FUNG|nr:hypothetical protein DFQ27_007014 [Actinomortierella ambigua]